MGRIADIHAGIAAVARATDAGEHVPYAGAPIHDGSPESDIRAALAAARTHPVQAVREILVARLTERLADAGMPALDADATYEVRVAGRMVALVSGAEGERWAAASTTPRALSFVRL